MALSACSRRLSGSVRARACSVTLSTASQPLAFRSSNTLSGLDALCRDTAALCTSGKDTALDAVGLGLLAGPAPATASHKHLGLSALGRPRPPARRSPNGTSHSCSVKQPPRARAIRMQAMFEFAAIMASLPHITRAETATHGSQQKTTPRTRCAASRLRAPCGVRPGYARVLA